MTNQTNSAGESIDRALAKSLKELSSKKPIDKITIREITGGAGVIRPTFYNHFQDKYELLEWIVRTELTEPANELIHRMKVAEGVSGVMEKMLEDRRFYEACVRLEGQNSFEQIFKEALRDVILDHVDEEILRKRLWYEWLTPERTAEFFAKIITNAVCEWIRDGMKVPIDEVLECFAYLTTHSIAEMLMEILLEKAK